MAQGGPEPDGSVLRMVERAIALLERFISLVDWAIMLAVAVGAFLLARVVLELFGHGPLVQYGGAALVALAAAIVARLVWELIKWINP